MILPISGRPKTLVPMADVTEYLRPDLIATVERLDLRARFIMEGFLAGLHSSPFHGFSVEFSEHRKYVRGDDPRLLDWSVYAKTDRLYIKKFQAETTLDAYLLMDTSASMGFPSPDDIEPGGAPRLSKLDYAICLAATLGHMMISQQDSVGMFAFDQKLRSALPPRSRRSHLTRLIAELARIRPTTGTGLGQSLHEVAQRVRKRGLMILFSDMFAESHAVIDALHHLRFRGHDLIVFCVLDAAEARFPYRGMTRFEAVERSDSVTGDALSLRTNYLNALGRFLDTYRDALSAVRAEFVQVDTSMTFDQALIPFLMRRRARF